MWRRLIWCIKPASVPRKAISLRHDAPSVLSPEIAIPSAARLIVRALSRVLYGQIGPWGLRVSGAVAPSASAWADSPDLKAVYVSVPFQSTKVFRLIQDTADTRLCKCKWLGKTARMTHPAYFFGYGSLVNRDTHQFEGAHPAQLRGWRRMWRHSKLREVAYLTVVPDPDGEIDGLIAEVPEADWAALDLRERAYDRVAAAHQVAHPLPHDPQIVVYSIPEGNVDQAAASGPVLLSYIDVVAQGYLREFGEDGVARFFETTKGWNVPVLHDRAAPLYPRHCSLSKAEKDLVDAHLTQLGVTFQAL